MMVLIGCQALAHLVMGKRTRARDGVKKRYIHMVECVILHCHLYSLLDPCRRCASDLQHGSIFKSMQPDLDQCRSSEASSFII
jgi:hypothetical protein